MKGERGLDLKEHFLKLRGGDKEAFIHIYNELKTPVFTIACRIVQSRESAEDITHDVFIKLFSSPPDSTVKNFRAWVFQMTRNLSLDALKKKTHCDIDEVELLADDDIGSVLTRMDIENAISKLKTDEREVLALHLTGGLGFKEIAHIIGESIPSVYRRYRKALSCVQDYLNGGEI